MRYQGGGVGHTYMRAIEIWLAETGWGSDDTIRPMGDDADLDEGDEGPGDEEDNEDPSGNSEDEVIFSDGDAVSDDTGSDQEHLQDIDQDAEYEFDAENEDTADGEYGFTSF